MVKLVLSTRSSCPFHHLALCRLALSACFSSGCSSNEAPPPSMPAVPVTVATAVQKNVPIQLRPIGNVESYASIPVKAQVAGELVRSISTKARTSRRAICYSRSIAALMSRRCTRPRPISIATRAGEAGRSQLGDAMSRKLRTRARRRPAMQSWPRKAWSQKSRTTQCAPLRSAADESTRADQAALESARAALLADKAAVETAKLNLEYCEIRRLSTAAPEACR